MNLSEGFQYKELVGLLKSRIHIDEFSSKMGDDDDILVISFYSKNEIAADDLVNWFEKGYDFVLDADRSPGEIKPNRYLVYIEMLRRSSNAKHVQDLLDDLSTLTEYDSSEWEFRYKNQVYPWQEDTFKNLVPDSPKKYREEKESTLNSLREIAGLDHKNIYKRDKILKELQNIAGI